MKNSVVLLLLATLISCSSLNFSKPEANFDYLLGTWERTNGEPGTKTIESWTKISDEIYSAISVVVMDSDTVYKETVRLEKLGDTYFYRAEVPQNLNPTNFRVVDIGQHGFSAINPNNDFPKRIKYRGKSTTFLYATISGNGKKVLYVFKRIN